MDPIEVEAEEVVEPVQSANPVVQEQPVEAVADAVQEIATQAQAAATEAETVPGIIQIPAMNDGESPISIKLTAEDEALIAQRAAEIDLSDSNIIVSYGSSSQKNIADFSDNALQNVKTKDLGEVSGMITKKEKAGDIVRDIMEGAEKLLSGAGCLISK